MSGSGLKLTMALGAMAAWLLLGAASPGAGVREDPAKEQSEAYVALIQADQFRDAEEHAKAVLAYRDALDRYNRLSARFPDWETDVIQYRLAYCANQISAIADKTGKSEADWLAIETQASSTPEESAQPHSKALIEENRYLRQRLQELEDAPTEDVDELSAEVDRLKAENDRMSRELSSRSAPQEEVGGMKEELEASRKKQASLQRLLDDQKKEMSALSEELDAAKKQAELFRTAEKQIELLRELTNSLSTAAERSQREWKEQQLRLQQEQAEASNRIEQLKAECGGLKLAVEQKSQDFRMLEQKASGFEAERAAWSNQMEALTKEKEAAVKDGAEKLAAAEARLNEPNPLAAELEKAKEERQRLQQELADLRAAEKKAMESPEIFQPVYLHVADSSPAPVQASAFVSRRPLSLEEAEAMIKQGWSLERNSRFADALRLYDSLLEERPLFGPALKARGRCLLQTGDGAGALAALSACARQDASDLQTQLLLGMAYCRVQQFAAAVSVLRPLVLRDPQSVSARNVLGAALLGQGNMNEARLELEKVLRMNAQLSDTHYNLAQVYIFSRPPDYDQARRHYRKALELGASPDRDIEQMLK